MKSEPYFLYPSVLRGICFAALACLLSIPAKAAPPVWWTERSVLNPNATKNDFGPANVGQVMSIGSRAYEELQSKLPATTWATPAGQALGAMVSGWVSPEGYNTNHEAIINQGQLKTIARKFYDVLIQIGHSSAYPWTADKSDDASYAPANIGQVKNLFAFDMTNGGIDSDHDGIADWWELLHGLNPANGSDANAICAAGEMTNLQKFQLGLDPTKLDTDGDGFSDLYEINNGTSPSRSGPIVSLVAPSWATLSN